MIFAVLEIVAVGLGVTIAWTRSAAGAADLSPVAASRTDVAWAAYNHALATWAVGMLLLTFALRRSPPSVRRGLVAASGFALAFQASIEPVGAHVAGRGDDGLVLGLAVGLGALARGAAAARGWQSGPFGILLGLVSLGVVLFQWAFGDRVGGQVLQLTLDTYHVQGVEFAKVLGACGLTLAWSGWREGQAGPGAPIAAATLTLLAFGGVVVLLNDAGGAAVSFAVLGLFATAVLARGAVGPLPLATAGLLLVPSLARAAANYASGGLGARLRMFLDPWAATDRFGEHLALAAMAIAGGGWFGRGAGRVVTAHLPEGRTDFAIATLCEAWGGAGAVAWVGLIAGIVLALSFSAARDADDPWGALPGALAALVAAQAFVGSGGPLGLVVLTGVVSPFLSSSTSFAAALGIGIGIACRPVAESSVADATLRRVGLHAASAILALLAGVLLQASDRGLRSGRRVAVAPDANGEPRVVHDPRYLDVRASVPGATVLDGRGQSIVVVLPDGERRVRPSPAWTPVVGTTDGRWPLEGTFEHRRRVLDAPPTLHAPDGRLAYDLSAFGPVVHATGEDMRRTATELVPPPLQTGIDRRVQERIYASLPAWAASTGAVRIAVSVVELATGLERARVSFPSVPVSTVPLNALSDLLYIGRFGFLRDLVAMTFPPGSTMKPAVMLAAQRAGLPLDRTWPCDGVVVIRDGHRSRTIHDHEGTKPRGLITLADALPPSCNTTFSAAGAEIGGAVLRDTLRPLLPDLTIADDPIGAALASIGQDKVEWTPYDAALLYGALGGDGTALRCPRLWRGEPTCTRIVLATPAEVAPIRAALREVVLSGTGRGARLPDSDEVQVIGKSGTAEQGRVLPDDPRDTNIAWFNGVIEGPESLDGSPRTAQFAFSILAARTEKTGGALSPLAVEIARILVSEGYVR